MWNNRELKKSAKSNLKKNYWACIGICFLLLVFAAEYTSSSGIFGEKSDYGINESSIVNKELTKIDGAKAFDAEVTGSDLANELIDKLTSKIEDDNTKQATTGVMATIANGLTQTAHMFTFAYDGVQKVLSDSKPAQILVSFLGAFLSFAYYLFLQIPLRIGERRFFLENRLYHETRITRVFYIYSTPYTWNVSKIMLIKAIKLILWAFTIVGLPMKFYEYRAIPYILAENPEINSKDCFRLAKELTYGHKIEMFKFDFTYVLWMILGTFAFGLISIFFINPYYRAGQSEVHVKLREHAKARAVTLETESAESDVVEFRRLVALLNDELLYADPADERVAEIYPKLKVRAKHELPVEWDRKYTFLHIGLIFFAFAMIGYCWEVLYQFILDGALCNRGSLWGPWIPIYGVGGASVIVFLKPLGKNPKLMAALTFVLCGVIEYFTAWYFETFRHIKFWDYSDYLFNIQGRVCLEGLIMFTVLASLGLYVIAPRLDDFFAKWPNRVKVPLLTVLLVAFFGDMVYTYFHPHTGDGISSSADYYPEE